MNRPKKRRFITRPAGGPGRKLRRNMTVKRRAGMHKHIL